jgi:hypothetical protein
LLAKGGGNMSVSSVFNNGYNERYFNELPFACLMQMLDKNDDGEAELWYFVEDCPNGFTHSNVLEADDITDSPWDFSFPTGDVDSPYYLVYHYLTDDGNTAFIYLYQIVNTGISYTDDAPFYSDSKDNSLYRLSLVSYQENVSVPNALIQSVSMFRYSFIYNLFNVSNNSTTVTLTDSDLSTTGYGYYYFDFSSFTLQICPKEYVPVTLSFYPTGGSTNDTLGWLYNLGSTLASNSTTFLDNLNIKIGSYDLFSLIFGGGFILYMSFIAIKFIF